MLRVISVKLICSGFLLSPKEQDQHVEQAVNKPQEMHSLVMIYGGESLRPKVVIAYALRKARGSDPAQIRQIPLTKLLDEWRVELKRALIRYGSRLVSLATTTQIDNGASVVVFGIE